MTAFRATVAVALGAALIAAAAPALAGPLFWDWPEGESFGDVVFDGAALDSAGHLVAGLGARALEPTGPEVFWCVTADGKGGVLAGTGHGGEIHRTDARGRSELVARVDAAEVFSLLPRPDGGLLAGCGPDGQLMRVAPDGTTTELGRVPGGYIWAMTPGPDGKTVWLATGSPAAVWKLTPAGELVEVANLAAQNVLDLAWDGAGRLLAATQGPGLVYRLDPGNPQEPEVLFEAPQSEVRQFIAGPGGVLHVLALEVSPDDAGNGNGSRGGGNNGAASGGNGHGSGLMFLRDSLRGGPSRAALYRIGEDGLVSPAWVGETDLMIAAWTERWGWVGGGVVPEEGGRSILHRLTPPAGMQPLAGWDGGDVMAILADPAQERLVVCEAHPGGLTELSEDPAGRRSALSAPIDAGRSVRWGRLRWTGGGDLGGLRWSARSGNRAEPDAEWSDWSGEWTGNDEPVPAPPGRYLQWRVTFPGGKAGAGGRVTGVSVSAWRDNLAPSVDHFAQEQVAAIISGGLMPRGDNVTQTLRSGVRVEFSRPSSRDQRADEERAAATRSSRTFSWLASDPDGDRLVYDLAYRREDDGAWRPILTGTEESLAMWETADLPDGSYEVQLTVSDRLDNPASEAAATTRVLGPVHVDNTPPVVSRLALERADGGVRVRFRAEDGAGVLSSATVVLPDGTQERLDPTDRICDSSREEFDRIVPWPRDGVAAGAAPWPLRVEVRDLGGNLGFAEGEVR